MKILQWTIASILMIASCLVTFPVFAGSLNTQKNQSTEQKQDIQTLKEKTLNMAKKNFAAEKQAILQRVVWNNITEKEARTLIEKAKQNTLNSAKAVIREWIQQQKTADRTRVKKLIVKKMQKILSKTESLPPKKRAIQYEKLLQAVDRGVRSGKLSDKERILSWLIKEVIIESQNEKK